MAYKYSSFRSLSFLSSFNITKKRFYTTTMGKERVCIIGSGNW
jgi:hypothetical protein